MGRFFGRLFFLNAFYLTLINTGLVYLNMTVDNLRYSSLPQGMISVFGASAILVVVTFMGLSSLGALFEKKEGFIVSLIVTILLFGIVGVGSYFVFSYFIFETQYAVLNTFLIILLSIRNIIQLLMDIDFDSKEAQPPQD